MAKVVREPVSGLKSWSEVKSGDTVEHIETGDVFLVIAQRAFKKSPPTRGNGPWRSYEVDEPSCWIIALVRLSDGVIHPFKGLGLDDGKDDGCRETAVPGEFRLIQVTVSADPAPRRMCALRTTVIEGELLDGDEPERLGEKGAALAKRKADAR